MFLLVPAYLGCTAAYPGCTGQNPESLKMVVCVCVCVCVRACVRACSLKKNKDIDQQMCSILWYV